MNRFALLLLLLFPCSVQGQTEDIQGGVVSGHFYFAPNSKSLNHQLTSFQLGPNVVIDKKSGSIRLADSRLLTEETGATDYKQSERLTKSTLAKKEFVLDSVDTKNAELFFFGSARKVEINGHNPGKPERLKSTGWSRLRIPIQYLQKGKNTFIFRDGGQLLVEPGRRPGHSFKSIDGGKTWSRQGLTSKGNLQGEYVARLRLGQQANEGWAVSQVLDWHNRELVNHIPSKRDLHELTAPKFIREQKKQSNISLLVRIGSTPTPDAKHWTGWIPLTDTLKIQPEKKDCRWLQLKFILTSETPNVTPKVPATFSLGYGGYGPPDKNNVRIIKLDQPKALRTSVPFVYQKPSPRLKLLRERYKLDAVIAPGKTEMEKLILLRHWVRNQWHTAWGNDPAQWMPPWDALVILECKDQKDCLTMCTHYAAVYTQCCLALGWNARHCILDHHCVAEVYVTGQQKWVMMDAGNSKQRPDCNLHFERNGKPMSARELLLAFHNKKTDGIVVQFTPQTLMKKIAHLCRPVPKTQQKHPPRPDQIPLARLTDYPVCQLNNYRRYAFPGRNNFLDSLLPGELYQGWSSYFFDGYWWVGDSPDDPTISPEYSFHLDPKRAQDVDWKLNWTHIYLSRTEKPNQLRVHLDTETPNLKSFRKQVGKSGKDQPCPATFLWDLLPGKNSLTVRSVNQWDREGTPSHVVVEWNKDS